MSNEALDLLRQTQAVLEHDHFVGTSGRHMPRYINKDALYPHTAAVSRMGELFAEANAAHDPEVVVGPALGGIILSTWAAYHLSRGLNSEVLGIYTEKGPNHTQIFTRGYDALVKGRRILVVEDLTTTGGSVKSVVESVRQAGGEVMNVCVMVNRDPQRVTSDTIGAPFSSLAVLETPSYTPEECPLCQDHVPINTSVGHGKSFVTSQRAS